MKKIKEILIGTNNPGKYKEICALLPKKIKKHSLNEFKILIPKETGKSFKENSFIKASYFCKKTNLICLSDDSGLEIDLLNGAPGIYSSRWSGKKKNFNLNPVTQITAIPPIIISTAVPKSGCDATKKTGTSKATRGRIICFILVTFSDGIL